MSFFCSLTSKTHTNSKQVPRHLEISFLGDLYRKKTEALFIFSKDLILLFPDPGVGMEFREERKMYKISFFLS